MKRNVLIAAIAAALFSTAALAHGGFGPHGQGPGHGMGYGMMHGGGPGMGMGPGMGRGMGPGAGAGPGACLGADAMAALNLSKEQREKIADIQGETSKKQLELAASMRELRTQAFRDGKRGPGKNYEAMADLRKKMFELTRESREKVDAVLTPEQRAQWRPGWRGIPWRG